MAKRKKRNRGGGVPFNPDVDTGTKRPVTARVAVGDVNDKFSDYPSNGLTPRRLARIFREADEGNVRAQMELFEEMEEKDTHLFSQMQTRKLAVTGLDWEVQPFSEDEIDKEIADFIDEQLKGIENFDEVLIDMLDAIGKGISIMELAWTVEDGRNVIEDIEYVHPKRRKDSGSFCGRTSQECKQLCDRRIRNIKRILYKIRGKWFMNYFPVFLSVHKMNTEFTFFTHVKAIHCFRKGHFVVQKRKGAFRCD